MRWTTLTLLAFSGLFAIVPGAKAELVTQWNGSGSGISGGTGTGIDPLFSFSISLDGNVANALLTTTDLGGGQFLVTGGTLHVTAGAAVGNYPLFPGGPAAFFSPSGAFIVDNVLYPTSNPVLDVDGLLFSGSGLEINIWATGPDNYSFFAFNGSSFPVAASGTPDSIQVSSVPEPSSLALVCLGSVTVGGWYGVRRRRRKVLANTAGVS